MKKIFQPETWLFTSSNIICQYSFRIFQIFDYAQYYLNLRSANTRDKTQTAADSDFASHGSEEKEAPAAVEAQWRLEYNFTMHYRFRRRRMPGHLGRGIITSSVLEGLERKLANNRYSSSFISFFIF